MTIFKRLFRKNQTNETSHPLNRAIFEEDYLYPEYLRGADKKSGKQKIEMMINEEAFMSAECLKNETNE